MLVSHDHGSLICSILRIYKQINICSTTKFAFKFSPFMSRSPTGRKKNLPFTFSPSLQSSFQTHCTKRKTQSIKNQKLYTSQQRPMELLGDSMALVHITNLRAVVRTGGRLLLHFGKYSAFMLLSCLKSDTLEVNVHRH